MRVVDASSEARSELSGPDARVGLRRDVRLDGPVVLVAAEPLPDVAALTEIGQDERWQLVTVADATGACRVTSIQNASLVAVVGSQPQFAIDVVRAVRGVTSAPAVVVGDLELMARVRVLTDGADMVLPTGLDRGELRARVVALLRRATETWEPAVRY